MRHRAPAQVESADALNHEFQKLREYLAHLPGERCGELEHAAVAAAAPFAQQRYRHLQSTGGPAYEALRLGLIQAYLRRQQVVNSESANPLKAAQQEEHERLDCQTQRAVDPTG
ncbi:MAG TPA: hypothetical protein VFE46_01700 [Pirellulales bacterium]|nr:hypothetical protein [Pirellulales bacterium]